MTGAPTGLTNRQLREVNTTIRHLGRAMDSLSRAKVDTYSRTHITEWQCAYLDAERATAKASNRLIDALEALELLTGGSS